MIETVCAFAGMPIRRSASAKTCSWCLALSLEERQRGNVPPRKLPQQNTVHLPISVPLTFTTVTRMAAPFKDCVIALSGKFDETHGKQTFLPIPRSFTLGPQVNTELFSISTYSLLSHKGR